MRFILTVFVCFASTVSLAASVYQVSSELFIDGKRVFSPYITTLEGEPSEISTFSEKKAEHVTMKLLARKKSSKTLSIKFDLEYKSGNRTLKASPWIVAKLGEEVSISTGNKDGQGYELKVTAKKVE